MNFSETMRAGPRDRLGSCLLLCIVLFIERLRSMNVRAKRMHTYGFKWSSLKNFTEYCLESFGLGMREINNWYIGFETFHFPWWGIIVSLYHAVSLATLWLFEKYWNYIGKTRSDDQNNNYNVSISMCEKVRTYLHVFFAVATYEGICWFREQ